MEFKGIRDLSPGESISLPSPLTLQVIAASQQCHEATVTADGAESVSQRACVIARQAAIEVTLNGPRSRVVGQPAEFNAMVKNVSDVAATNVVIVLRFDPALNPLATQERAHDRLPDGGILFRVERLEPNERRPLPVVAQCVSQSNNACGKVVVTADGGVNQASQTCVEILPPMPGQPGAAAPSVQSGLRLSFVVPNNPARSGEATIIYAYVDNRGHQTEQQVSLRILLPPQFVPDPAQIKPPDEATINGQEVSFQPANELAPQGRREYAIPVRITGQGSVQIRGAVTATNLVSPVVADSLPIEILPAIN